MDASGGLKAWSVSLGEGGEGPLTVFRGEMTTERCHMLVSLTAPAPFAASPPPWRGGGGGRLGLCRLFQEADDRVRSRGLSQCLQGRVGGPVRWTPCFCPWSSVALSPLEWDRSVGPPWRGQGSLLSAGGRGRKSGKSPTLTLRQVAFPTLCRKDGMVSHQVGHKGAASHFIAPSKWATSPTAVPEMDTFPISPRRGT